MQTWRAIFIVLATALSLFASALRAPTPSIVVAAHTAKLSATVSDADADAIAVLDEKKIDAPKTVAKRGGPGHADGSLADASTFARTSFDSTTYAESDHAVAPIFAELRVDSPTRGRARLQVFLN